MDLHYELIDFVLEHKFVFFEPEKVHNFKLFVERSKSDYLTGSFTEQMLCDEFVHNILPNIRNMSLDDTTRRAFELMQFNPNYARTATGFVLKDPAERLENSFREQDWRKFINVIDENIPKNSTINETVEKDNAPHTLLYSPTNPPPILKEVVSMTKETVLFVSASLSKDDELSRGVILNNYEIRRRLTEAKMNFEDKGVLPNYVLSPQVLKERLSLMYTLFQNTVKLRDDAIDLERS